jgi:hypothetical protein
MVYAQSEMQTSTLIHRHSPYRSPVVRAITVTAIAAPPPRNGSASGALTASTSASPNDLVHLGGFAAGLLCQLRSVWISSSPCGARDQLRSIL